MTDRFSSLTVTFEREMREDDAQALMDAIRCMRHVISVDGNVAGIVYHDALKRARYELECKLLAVLREDS